MNENEERYNFKPTNFTFVFHQKSGELRMQFDMKDLEEQMRLEEDIPASSLALLAGSSQQSIPDQDSLSAGIAAMEQEDNEIWSSLHKE